MEMRQQNLAFQKIIAITAVLLFTVKIAAWYITGSIAVLTDALESIVNILSGFVGFYSLYLSARPKDYNHPYGHGKVEFISAGIEGMLIVIAGGVIIYKALGNLNSHHSLERLDFGILLVASTAVINFLVGWMAIKKGKEGNSLPLIAAGHHLKSDTYSTLGIITGLILIALTGYQQIDIIVAVIFALVIIYTGIKIIRRSLAGIMDEADEVLLKDIVNTLNTNRKQNWIDMHNLRIIKYGSILHLDCHLTVPWFLNVREAHHEIDELSLLIREKYGSSVELFVHTDGCVDFSCKICSKTDCLVRRHDYIKKIEWTVANISENKKHEI